MNDILAIFENDHLVLDRCVGLIQWFGVISDSASVLIISPNYFTQKVCELESLGSLARKPRFTICRLERLINVNFFYNLKPLDYVLFSGCCIYEKPRKFGESSSSESDDECDHCQGHVERKKKRRAPTGDSLDEGDSGTHNSDTNQTLAVDN